MNFTEIIKLADIATPKKLKETLNSMYARFSAIDNELSETSTNPVQNKILKEKFDSVENGLLTINEKIDTLHANAFVIVEALPEASAEHLGKIYLLPGNNGDNNYYDEYIVIKTYIPLIGFMFGWEKIGNTSIDLNKYVKKTDIAAVTSPGVVYVNPDTGIGSYNGTLYIRTATKSQIDLRQNYAPITAKNLEYAVKSGLVNNAEELSEKEKSKISSWLGLSNGGSNKKYLHDFYIYSDLDGEWNYESFIHIKMLSSQSTRFSTVSDVFNSQQSKFKPCVYFCVAKHDMSNGALEYQFHESIEIYDMLMPTDEGYSQYEVYCNGFVLDMYFNTNTTLSYDGVTEL